MTGRAVGFALSRPRVVIPGLVGLGLMLIGVPKLVGVILLAVTALRAARLLRYDDLDDRLRLRQQKRMHRVHRRLTDSEREEVFALDNYCTDLRATGTDAVLVDETMSEAWRIIREAGRHDATEALHRFRMQLPGIDTPSATPDWRAPDLRARLEREQHLLRASRREVDLSAAS